MPKFAHLRFFDESGAKTRVRDSLGLQASAREKLVHWWPNSVLGEAIFVPQESVADEANGD
jgi:hypothetical protein